VDVGDTVTIGSNSWLYPYSQGTNGGSVLFRMRNLSIATNAGFNAVGRGYGIGQGPGRGFDDVGRGGGGGYGGQGGNGSGSAGGSTNGHMYAPLSCGSGGGRNPDAFLNQVAFGGGLVHVQASLDVLVNGQILANGAPGKAAWIYCGGGAGGGILIECCGFTGSGNAQLFAVGGESGYSATGSGGGGRVAVWYDRPFPPDVRNLLLAGKDGQSHRIRQSRILPGHGQRDQRDSRVAGVQRGSRYDRVPHTAAVRHDHTHTLRRCWFGNK
jgi:hypothetical protein